MKQWQIIFIHNKRKWHTFHYIFILFTAQHQQSLSNTLASYLLCGICITSCLSCFLLQCKYRNQKHGDYSLWIRGLGLGFQSTVLILVNFSVNSSSLCYIIFFCFFSSEVNVHLSVPKDQSWYMTNRKSLSPGKQTTSQQPVLSSCLFMSLKTKDVNCAFVCGAVVFITYFKLF